VLLRESYREAGKVKNRTIANLSHCKAEEIAAIRLALKHKGDLGRLEALSGGVELTEGLRIGAVWTVLAVARRLGIDKALGAERAGRLGLWQVLARVIDQGSRLSAVRLGQSHAACDALGLKRGFDENDLYENLSWLEANQATIETRLFRARHGQAKPALFLYDVTSSYLEGQCNALGDYGYNRDRKRGKKQIVVGLLCDAQGAPVSVEVFRGNTQDLSTFSSQVHKAAGRFGCRTVTFVGDRGMLKGPQIAQLTEAGFHYIGALTKPQIEKLLGEKTFQMDMFDQTVCEVQGNGVRYVLRRNPVRAAQLAQSRRDKEAAVARLIAQKNLYLAEHRRARPPIAARDVGEKIERLALGAWLRVETHERALRLVRDEAALDETSRLDGCYAIKTDLPAQAADAQMVHDRYRDLAQVERAFRTCKTAHLEMRPIHVRTAEHTRAHALVVMLAYLIVRVLRRAWADLDLTVEEGLDQLGALSTMRLRAKGAKAQAHQIPKPNPMSARLLAAAGVRMPKALPSLGARVVTRRKLTSRRVKP
jgi:hypothetical protein